MPTCSKLTCKKTKKNGDGIPYHRFPKVATIRKKWTNFCGHPPKIDRVEFEEAWSPNKLKVFVVDISQHSDSVRKILLPKAVPSIEEPEKDWIQGKYW